MRTTALFPAALVILATLAPVPARAADDTMEKLRHQAHAQWLRWVEARDPEKRRYAAEGLAGSGEHAETPGLLAGLLDDRDPAVRLAAAVSLWKLGDAEVDLSPAVGALRGALGDPDPAIRVQAAGALERAGVDPRELVAARRSVIAQGDWFDVALAARDLVGWVDGTELVDPLLWSLRQTPPGYDDDRFEAVDVFEALVREGGDGVLPGLMRALSDPRLPKVALIGALATRQPPPPGWREALLELTADADPETRELALEQLRRGVVPGATDLDWLARIPPLLQDRERDVRYAACDLLGAAGGAAHGAVDALIALLEEERDAPVQRAALRALGAIGDSAEAYDRAIKQAVATRARPLVQRYADDAAADPDTRAAAQQALRALAAGSATHTQALPAAPGGDASALQRLRARGIEFTEDAFWRALGERDVATVRDLLDAGLSPEAITADGMPALHFALMAGCDYGRPTAQEARDIVAALLAHGADPNRREPGGDNPALHRATSCDGAMVKQLVAARADPNARNASKLTAFSSFVLTSPSGAAALLDAGYRPDANERTTLRAMLQGSTDAEQRRLLTRALGK